MPAPQALTAPSSASPGTSEGGRKNRRRSGPSRQILWGLLLGLACGLFFGELCRPLRWVGEAFVKLLQVTVLPYIMVSLILGIGSLTGRQARDLARKAGALMLGFWLIALTMVAWVPLSFPHWQSAAFFSASLVEAPPSQSLLDFYIPSNPFRSLSDNVVPAVVVFSLLVGVALMGIPEKTSVLRALGVATEALSRVTGFIVRLTPLGVFALVASAAGTMSLQEFGRLHVFLLAYVASALFLTFWVLPMLVTVATPFRYGEVVLLARDALITAFVTGNVFVVLPVLTQRVKHLFRSRDLGRPGTEAYADVIVPVAFNFPNLGEVLLLVFIPFAAWFSGAPLEALQYPRVLFTGVLSAFGSLAVGIPYLLDQLQLPADLFQLFVIAGLGTNWFSTLLAAMGLLTFAILSVAVLTGVASLQSGRLLRLGVLTLVLAGGLVLGLRLYFAAFVRNTYSMTEVVGRMHLLREPWKATVHTAAPPAPPHTPGRSRLEEIRMRGFLRVGYLEDRLPHAFRNARGDLVGHDVELAHDLARTLNVSLELVPLDRDRMADQVNAGECDLLMSGVGVTPERAAAMNLSTPYRSETMAFLVPSHRRKEFRSLVELRHRPGLRLGLLGDPYHLAQLRDVLPGAIITVLDSPREFFEATPSALDAFVFTAESGSAWTLLYPRFTPVVPQPGLRSIPLAFALPRGETELTDYVNAWILLKLQDGTMSRLHDYWILGQGAEERPPRWCVIRDVLHWRK